MLRRHDLRRSGKLLEICSRLSGSISVCVFRFIVIILRCDGRCLDSYRQNKALWFGKYVSAFDIGGAKGCCVFRGLYIEVCRGRWYCRLCRSAKHVA
jgi:hypothetical protein